MTEKKNRRKTQAAETAAPRPEGEESSGTNSSVVAGGRPAGETEKTPGANADPFRFAGTSTWSQGGRFVIKYGQRVPETEE